MEISCGVIEAPYIKNLLKDLTDGRGKYTQARGESSLKIEANKMKNLCLWSTRAF